MGKKNIQNKVVFYRLKTALCVLTFKKWIENCVQQLMSLVYHFPVPFKNIKACYREKAILLM